MPYGSNEKVVLCNPPAAWCRYVAISGAKLEAFELKVEEEGKKETRSIIGYHYIVSRSEATGKGCQDRRVKRAKQWYQKSLNETVQKARRLCFLLFLLTFFQQKIWKREQQILHPCHYLCLLEIESQR